MALMIPGGHFAEIMVKTHLYPPLAVAGRNGNVPLQTAKEPQAQPA
ncbi:hypothetical protein AAB765_003658 [Vibrio parahaemolyticus]|nr:hypothetical protein [Vibrio parahaemolyticus]MBM5151348.1 hypothetical protein [Vibrio parahaemolyticus]MBM5164944.1 hypothetical protein [Vibrio parahaemolyticus]MBM5243981.1 hypothetical protein [Vibrio parahaemolyticus]MBM5275410.1 hypothetical protein [Vibrio parahaemolyticus]